MNRGFFLIFICWLWPVPADADGRFKGLVAKSVEIPQQADTVLYQSFLPPRSSRPVDPQVITISILKRLHRRGHLQHWIAHRGQAEAAVDSAEQLRLHHPGVIRQRGLMMILS